MAWKSEEDILKEVDEKIEKADKRYGWNFETIQEGRLKALELLVKAGAGWYNSHTEEGFLNMLNLMKKDRTLNKLGRQFVCHMTYNHSNKRPRCFESMEKYRR